VWNIGWKGIMEWKSSSISKSVSIMKIKHSILALALVAFSGANAQSFGEIHGRVVDEKNQPLPFVNVYTEVGTRTLGTVTDEDGRFKLKPLPSGVYNLQFSLISYSKKEVNAVTVDPDKIRKLLTVVMAEESYMIGGPAEIITYTDALISYDGDNMSVIRAAEIRQSPAQRDVRSLVASLTTDVYQSPIDGQLYFRGSRGGNVLYFVDGVKMNQDPRIPASGLSSVMVYSGGVPAKFGDCVGGFVIIETKNYFDLYNQYIARHGRTIRPASETKEID
jgi:hypothetical protein